jgi:hypothetical protein
MFPLSLQNIPASFADELASRYCARPADIATTHVGNVALPQATPFDSLSLAASAVTILLMGAIALALLLRRGMRRAKRGRWLIVLALASIAFSALTLTWIWQLRATYVSGCLIFFNAAPFSQEQANLVAPLAFLGVVLLLALWLALAARFALVRQRVSK